MSAWSGYRVELASAPEIQIWPTFKAVLSDVRLSDWDDAGRRPVLDAERVELELSPIAALQRQCRDLHGQAGQADALCRARSRRTATRRSRRRSAASGTRIEGARAIVAENPANPDLSALADESFGTVEFSDGQDHGPSAAARRADGHRACRRHRMGRAQPHGELVGQRHLARRELLGRRLVGQAAHPVCRRLGAADARRQGSAGLGQLRRRRQLVAELLLRRPADVQLAVAEAHARMVAHRPAARRRRPARSRCRARSPATASGSSSTMPRSRSTAIRAAGVLDLSFGDAVPGISRHARLRPARPALLPVGLHAVHAGLGIRALRRSTSPSPRNTISTSGFRPPRQRPATSPSPTSRRRRRSRATSPPSTFPTRRSSAARCRPACATTARAKAATSRCRLLASDIDTRGGRRARQVACASRRPARPPAR